MKSSSQKKFLVLLLLASFPLGGCSSLTEFPKKIWGSSTKDLEKARETALQKTFHCSVAECFDAVLRLTSIPKPEENVVEGETDPTDDKQQTHNPYSTRPPGYGPRIGADDPSLPITPPADTSLRLFLKDRRRNLIVVMGVPNCVDTTEVGIFFTPQDSGNVKVELSSLSSKAKRNAAELIFGQLDKHFPEIQ
jgi:hypothetical protein